jgi:hypothetical protein
MVIYAEGAQGYIAGFPWDPQVQATTAFEEVKSANSKRKELQYSTTPIDNMCCEIMKGPPTLLR